MLQNGWKQNIRTILFGWIFAILISALLLGIAAAILAAAGTLPSYLFSPIVVICTSAGTLLSGFWAGKRNRSRGILWGLLCGFLMLLTEVLIGVWLMVPSYQDGQAVTKAAAMLISGAIGGILGANHTEKIK